MDAATRRAMVAIVGDEKEMFPSKSALGRWCPENLLSKPRSIEGPCVCGGKVQWRLVDGRSVDVVVDVGRKHRNPRR
jgi:hypothetical protein